MKIFVKKIAVLIFVIMGHVSSDALADNIHWIITDPPGYAEQYNTAASACSAAMHIIEERNVGAYGHDDFVYNYPEPIFRGGSFLLNNGKDPSDPDSGFIYSNRELWCNHEFSCFWCDPPGFYKFSPYAGGIVKMRTPDTLNDNGRYCEPKTTWDSFEKGCLPSRKNAGEFCGAENVENTLQSVAERLGNPIHAVTGNKFQKETDYVSESLKFIRYYNSYYESVSSLGRQWLHTYNRRIAKIDGNVLVLGREDGKIFRFNYTDGTWFSDDAPIDSLKNVDLNWEFTNNQGETELYGFGGQLLSITKQNGRQVTLEYDAGSSLKKVSDDIGNSLVFTYKDRILQSVTLPGNRVIRYNYDDYDNLISVHYPDDTPNNSDDNPSRIYHYENTKYKNHLTGITDERGIRYATFEYDDKGRANSSYHAGNAQRVDIVYNEDGTRTVTNSRGVVSHYETATINNNEKVTSITGPGCVTCGSGNTTYVYDTNGTDPVHANLLSKTEHGITTAYGGYNYLGNYTAKTEAVGTPEETTTTYSYNDWFPNKIDKITEPSIISGQNKITTYYYDSKGNRKGVSVDGSAPDGSGGFKAVSRSASYQYQGPLGQLSMIDGPRYDVDDITTLDYYENDPAEGNNRARLKKVTGPENLILRDNIQYTATGKVASETRSNGLSLVYNYYSGNDRLESITESDGIKARTTRWTYLASGEVETITQAYGTALATTVRLDYDDARRLVGIIDNVGNEIKYTLDTEGNIEQQDIKDSDGVLYKTLQQTFDNYNRVDTRTIIDQIVNYNYAPNGTLESQTDAKNVTTDYSYDSLKKLTAVVGDSSGSDPNTQDTLTEYVYDVADRLVQVKAPNDASTNYIYDDLGNLLQETSPDRGTIKYTYDFAGNVKTVTDARNITAAYTYDGLSRVTSIDYPGDAEDITFVYDAGADCSNAAGKLCQITDQSGTTVFQYDSFGNLTRQDKTESGVTYSTQYEYDLLNRIDSMTLPTGRAVDYQYNSLGQITSIDATVNGSDQTIIHDATYRADGLLNGMDFGNGFVAQNYYNMKGQLTTINMPVTSSNQLIAINDSIETLYEQPVTISVLGNDVFANEATVNVSILSTTTYGALVVNADKTITYSPAIGYVGVDSFLYEISNESGADTAAVEIRINNPDTDGDGMPDTIDTDDDNDGIPDEWELAYGLNPLDASDAEQDVDGDGYSNLSEYQLQTHPLVKSNQHYYVLNSINANNPLEVVSLVDDNSIIAGSTTLTLDRFQRGTIPAADISLGTLITGAGPFDTGSEIPHTDMQMPAEFAGRAFVVPHFRNTHSYYLLSPKGDANVTIKIGGSVNNLTLVQGVSTLFTAGSSNAVSAIVTSDLPILMSHIADPNDAYIVPPAARQLVGIFSTAVAVGALVDNTTVTIYASDGASQTFTLNAGGYFNPSAGTNEPEGQGNAYHIVADKPIAAIQAADTDGGEATAFLSPDYFTSRFALPIDAQYIAAVCLQSTSITLSDPVTGVQTQNCSSDGITPGKVYFGSSVDGVNITAGSSLESNAPIYAMFEGAVTNNEQNWLGDVQMASISSGNTGQIPDTGVPVIWTNLVNVTVNADTLTKSSGINGGWDAGTASLQRFEGDGAVEFKIPTIAGSAQMVGFSSNNTNAGYSSIDFALYTDGAGNIRVFEKGVEKGIFGIYADGDILRLERVGITVTYKHNDVIIYTSTAISIGALIVDTSLAFTNKSAISEVLLYGANSPIDSLLESPKQSVTWTDMVNVTPVGGILTKSGGANGAWDAGSASVQRINADGVVEFKIPTIAGSSQMVGLSNNNTNANYSTIKYALYTDGAGTIRVFENSVEKGVFGTYAASDVLQIVRLGTAIYYRHNGKIIYTSLAPSTGPLLVDTSLAFLNTSGISDAVIYDANSSTASLSTSSNLEQLAVNKIDNDYGSYLKVSNSPSDAYVSPEESRQLIVISSGLTKDSQYTVYRKGPETNSEWIQTAEDPNSYDRPATVYYVARDAVNVWRAVNEKEIDGDKSESRRVVHKKASINMNALLAKLNQDPVAWREKGFIKVSHGTAGNPVSIDSELWTYSYDANGNVENITSSAGNKLYGYDALNRLTEDTQGEQSTQAIVYDRNGNRASHSIDAIVNSYGYITDSNKLTTDPLGSVEHDAAGNRTSDQGGTRTFEYNNAGRLYKVYEAGQLVATYIYNAQGQRTRKTTNAGTIIYHYDLFGNLVSETTQNGNAVRDYVYMNSVPVAQIDTAGTTDTVSYLHTDHLGTPRRATNDAGNVVWSWDSDAFGTTAANEDPDNDGMATIINLRFAGQYYDAETALHYNYFRYYDPSTGRYVTSDPVGLLAGTNTYAYVGGNPLFYIDPYGLWSIGDPLPQWLVDGAAGFGDGISSIVTFGIYNTADLREDLGIDGGVNECSSTYKGSKYAGYAWGVGTGVGAVGSALKVKVSFFSGGNVFKIISKTLRAGFRVDRAHHGKPWGHRHWWRW